MTVIETERLLLENWRPEDLSAFRPIATDPEVMRFIAEGRPWADDRIAQFIERQIKSSESLGYCLWKLTDRTTGRLLGHFGIQKLYDTGEIEIGWWLARAWWGRGLATEAARAALRYGFDVGGLSRIVAIAWPENVASINIIRKLGMTFAKNVSLGELNQSDSTLPLVMYAVGSYRSTPPLMVA